jgi:MFS family permease
MADVPAGRPATSPLVASSEVALTTPATSPRSALVPGAGWALALLLAINLFNYIDRQVLSATLPKIRLDPVMLRPDDPWAQTKLGGLTTAFMVAYMLFSPLFGRWGDCWSRWAIVGGAVIVWSLATGGSGLATGYVMLLLTRCLVGIGEAAYGPIAPAMLSDLYPVDHRGRIMAWFYMAIPVGSALGFVIGAQVAEMFGWRWAFLIVVLPGVLLGMLCFFMKEPPRSSSSSEASGIPSLSYGHVLRELAGIRSFVLCSAGMTLSTFVLGGVATVMQLYLFEREARFAVTAENLQRLKQLQTADGTPIIPQAVLDKLLSLQQYDRMDAAELRSRLQGILDPAEYQLYSSWIFDTVTAPGSWTNGMIGLGIGGLVVLGGLLATLLGGVCGDYLRNRGVRGSLLCRGRLGHDPGFSRLRRLAVHAASVGLGLLLHRRLLSVLQHRASLVAGSPLSGSVCRSFLLGLLLAPWFCCFPVLFDAAVTAVSRDRWPLFLPSHKPITITPQQEHECVSRAYSGWIGCVYVGELLKCRVIIRRSSSGVGKNTGCGKKRFALLNLASRRWPANRNTTC